MPAGAVNSVSESRWSTVGNEPSNRASSLPCSFQSASCVARTAEHIYGKIGYLAIFLDPGSMFRIESPEPLDFVLLQRHAFAL